MHLNQARQYIDASFTFQIIQSQVLHLVKVTSSTWLLVWQHPLYKIHDYILNIIYSIARTFGACAAVLKFQPIYRVIRQSTCPPRFVFPQTIPTGLLETLMVVGFDPNRSFLYKLKASLKQRVTTNFVLSTLRILSTLFLLL